MKSFWLDFECLTCKSLLKNLVRLLRKLLGVIYREKTRKGIRRDPVNKQKNKTSALKSQTPFFLTNCKLCFNESFATYTIGLAKYIQHVIIGRFSIIDAHKMI